MKAATIDMLRAYLLMASLAAMLMEFVVLHLRLSRGLFELAER